ncbi:ABC transporter permease [Gardnerella greenwoodii]|uniref:ABC-type transport system for lipoprotein release permease component n=1 Tax=Gardnerella greenwoodii 00703Dmash TaxID=698960 RepID=I4MBT6_9BIFI|nr:ABC transporter permease [Gardnerella greenwoodii]EIK86676.1 ABC-type transport system for lipoprotein release permease component [Gardnerella greenwoodii 00703Dmash]
MSVDVISLCSRAWLAIFRKPRRNAIIVLIMTLVLSALVSQAGISASVDDARNHLQSSIGLGFTVRAKTRGETLPEKMNANSNSVATSNSPIPQDLDANEGIDSSQIRKFAAIPGVKTVVEERDVLATPVGKQIVLPLQGPRLDDDVLVHAAGITGTTDSRLSQGFQEGLYRLEQGEHITNRSAGRAIVHRDFAKKNNLKIGSTITLKQGFNVKVSVVGIFAGKLQTKGALPSDASENRIFTDLSSALFLAGSAKRSVLRCVVERSDLLANAIRQSKTIAGKWADVEQNASQLSGVINSVNSVQQLVQMIFVALSFVGVLVLGLVLVFWVRARMHEIGVLMSIGLSKAVIVSQLLVEIVILNIVSFIISLGLGAAFSGVIGSAILHSANSSFIADGVAVLPLTQTFIAFVIGLLISIVALIISVIPMFIKKPRQILSAMS